MANKRKADDTPSGYQHNVKLQKTRPSTVLYSGTPKATKTKQHPAGKTSSHGAIIPVTPGAAVKTPTAHKQQPNPAEKPRPSQQQQKTKEGEKTAKAPEKNQPKETQSQKEPQPPSTLPLEPHAAVLKDIQSKYTVRTLSVISSTRMEKRIKAVLEHLATPATQSEHTTSAALPGVVLLHCRAADANKLISIVEVVKRRMREGHFATESTTDSAKPIKKKKGKKAQPSETTWYQYNRIYDVVVAKKDGNTDRAEEEEHDEDFAPMLHRFEEALNGKRGPAIMTYFSTFLSRTPIAELQKNPGMSCQSSVDPLEVEYQKWMANT